MDQRPQIIDQRTQIMTQISAASGRIGGYTLAIQQVLDAMHRDAAFIHTQREALEWINKTDAERDEAIRKENPAAQHPDFRDEPPAG